MVSTERLLCVGDMMTDYGVVSPQMVDISDYIKDGDVLTDTIVFRSYPHAQLVHGNVFPRKGAEPPNIRYAQMYEIARGMGIRRSLSRMSKFYLTGDEMMPVLKEYMRIRGESPSKGKYRDLMTAVSNVYDIEYRYDKTEDGHLLRMWGKSGKEWQFPIRRGTSKWRDHTFRQDYLDAMGVESLADTSYMGYKDLFNGVEHDLSGLFKRLVKNGAEEDE